MNIPALITGLAVTAPNGLTTDAWWSALLKGHSGIKALTRFDASRHPVTLAGQLPPYAEAEQVPSRLRPATDRLTRLTLTLAEQALADAGLDSGSLPADAGVVTATSSGGTEFAQRELQALWSQGRRHVSAYHSTAWFPAAGPGQVTIRHALHGPAGALAADHSGALDALAQARRHLRTGTPLMIAGGADSALTPWAFAAHLAEGSLSTHPDPARAYRPFDEEARGHVLGEGGALLILETPARARTRGATAYGMLAGVGATFDGAGAPRLRAAAELALHDAQLSPGDIGVVFADAAGNRRADRTEARAITDLFGPHAIPVTAPKTMTGRLLAAGGALDVAAALCALRHQVIPPTTATTHLAPDCPLDLVIAHPRPAPALRAALVLARGRGGFNSAAVLTTTT